MPKFKCKDIGVDCIFKGKAKTEEKFMSRTAKHAKGAHNYGPIPDEILEKVKNAIK